MSILVKQQNSLLGAWEQALGTVLSAVGNTPSIALTSEVKENLDLIGNVMQATGNALQVEQFSLKDINSIANEIQAVGNVTEVASLHLPVSVKKKRLLNIQGNLLQALGGSIAFTEEWHKELTIEVIYSGVGNLLQAIGNSLQSIANQNTPKAEELNAIGNWIQATGAIMTAIAETIQ
ncbi:DUF6944 family repetitive protein [Gracilibacillus suaedae]|uniref:DUF6944 family repetitive protein n=1 Tax=Gracilibacillus suaedae TaxID=2820273 RepID=UPI001ABE4D52|nr:hypothetical protein [Gracilibacillus suaedae]